MWTKLVKGVGTKGGTFCYHTRRRLVLSLPSSSCSGHYRLMATASGTVGGQNVSAQSKLVVPSFKRIRLVYTDDFLGCYSVVASYINHPEAAGSVEECIIHPPDRDLYTFGTLNRTPAGIIPAEFDDSVHRLIKDYVGTLGLGEEMTGKMLTALDMKKQQLQDPQQRRVLSAGRPRSACARNIPIPTTA
ncbi:hypothetical protein CONLIGDRAFT_61911 [Coniochaeta ligniaria NRRL 30616]|uniref:Uncharacterized protein n=1 Tax=Coniochaeta ligniaria NRRL 30616 TaxID=1408157 RepID=A0A1J7JQ36_9PEZI|nr:hypothetical protein CONLIGDRAFT_61911 [Coniochaeta ligniaria NRRL 30616]